LADFVAQLIALRQLLTPLRAHWWRSGPGATVMPDDLENENEE